MSYWKNKKVLITGASGFVGSNLLNRLVKEGARVYGTTKTGGRKNLYAVDVLNFKAVDKIFKTKKIEICFHLAAESLVESGQRNPYMTFKTNIDGTLNILESARKNNVDRLIVASTAHVYGDNTPPFVEAFTPKPSRPYETSKACTDLIAQSYADTFSLPVLIPRFVNIYGPGDLNFNRLIPKTIETILKGNQPEMWGGKASRDFLYIDDAVDAYLKLARLPKKLIEKNRIYNFGTGKVISVEDLVKMILTISGSKLRIKKIKDERENEIDLQFVSSARAKRVINWKPKYNLKKGLGKTLAWYQEYFKTTGFRSS